MKTFAAVLCAMLATAGAAFAHGDGGGGGPVMAGGPVTAGGPPIMAPIASGFRTQGGVPIFSRPAPDRTVTMDRAQKKRAPRSIDYDNYADICRPLIYVPRIYQQYEVQGGAPCDVQTQNGMLSLPPAFAW